MLSPIDVMLLGMVIEVKPMQYAKADSPIDVMLLGMATEVNPMHSAKAKLPMDLTLYFSRYRLCLMG